MPWHRCVGTLVISGALLAGPAGAATDGSADRDLAAPCGGCHSAAADAAGGMPTLSGQTPAQLAGLLLAYKRDTRRGTLMNRIAKGYSDAELERLAAYLGSPPELP